MNTSLAELQSIVDELSSSRDHLAVLEAGCGSLTSIRLGTDAYIVGIDISAEQLARNTVVHRKVRANLETADLGHSEYDLVVCWDVLEHLAEPTNVVRKFLKAVKPGGLVLLAFPNVLSLKGLVAKYTPLSFHLAVHRLVYGEKVGTVAGYEVCPTYLRYSIAPRSIFKLSTRQGFDVDLFSTYESGMQRRLRERLGLVGRLWEFARVLVRSLSLGIIDAEATDCVLILRSPTSSGLSRPLLSRLHPCPGTVMRTSVSGAAPITIPDQA